MKKTLISASAFVFAVVGMVGVTPPVQAKKNNENKVTICHRTNSVKNPYVRISVKKSAADGVAGNSGSKPDHYGEHQGPVATSESVAQGLKDNKQKWGDIIPPVAPYHSGLNWTAEGQAVYNNGCKYASVHEEPKPPVTPGTTNLLTPSKNESQVKAPESGVNAGSADLKTAAVPAAVLLGSLGSIAYGAFRFRKFGA